MSEWRIFRRGECLGVFEAQNAADARDMAERAEMVPPGEKDDLWVEPRDEQTRRMRTFIVGVIEAMGLPSSEAAAAADVVLSGRGEVDPDYYLDRIAERFSRAPKAQPYRTDVDMDVREVRQGYQAKGRYAGKDYSATGPSERAAVAALKRAIERAHPEVTVHRKRSQAR